MGKPNGWKRKGSTVYELNKHGTNRWWLHVQSAGGTGGANERECIDIARLIEAVPELLEVLTAAVEYLESGSAIPSNGWGLLDRGANKERIAVLDRARAAIAKSTGEEADRG